MGRQCSECRNFRRDDDYSNNQWYKGDGFSRCMDCVSGRFVCSVCYKSCGNQNNLKMHMQVHRSRTVACPVCRKQNFKTGANAVAHVESGFCPGCPGRDRARKVIYDFATKQSGMRKFMGGTPLLTNGSNTFVPDLPYHCPSCNRSFRHASALLQHQDQKHNQTRMLMF